MTENVHQQRLRTFIGGAWDDGHSFWYVLMLISEADAFTVASFTIRFTVKGLLGCRPSKHQ